MPTNFSQPSQHVLLTRQRHEADKAGLHYDIRMVIGEQAFSWATKKEMPEPGKSILLHEQPVHDKSYALSERVVIPKGQYGAGITTLDFVRKAKLEKGKDYYTLHTHTGEKYLLKHLPQYGDGTGWLLKNLSKAESTPLTKSAAVIRMYQHEDTGRNTWVVEGSEAEAGLGKRWFKTNKVKHVMKKNKYLEKVASLEKQAWDGDYEEGNEYGISANRMTHHPDVIGMLRKAVKDPNVHVRIGDFTGDTPSSRENPEAVLAKLKEAEEAVGGKRFYWPRDYVWSIGMDKSNPIIKAQVGKIDKYGDPITETGAIYDYIRAKHTTPSAKVQKEYDDLLTAEEEKERKNPPVKTEKESFIQRHPILTAVGTGLALGGLSVGLDALDNRYLKKVASLRV